MNNFIISVVGEGLRADGFPSGATGSWLICEHSEEAGGAEQGAGVRQQLT